MLREYERLGFTLLKHQYRCRYGEIDLIFSKEGGVYFIEVRTKTSLAFGSPEESMVKTKIQRVHRIAEYFLQTQHVPYQFVQFDFVSVLIDRAQKRATLKRYPNAF